MTSASERPRGRELLVIWVVAFAIAIPLGVIGLRSLRSIEVPPSAAFEEYNAPRVDEFAARIDEGAFGIVAFGDSRLRNATPDSESFAAALTDAAGRDVVVLKLVNDWAIYDDFAPFSERILDAEPHLVLFQEELRERHRGLDAEELLQREYLAWRILQVGSWSPGSRDQDYLQLSADCSSNETVPERRVRMAQWLSFQPDGPTAERAADFISALEARGIDHRFLGIPVTEEAREGLPGIEWTDGPAGIQPDFAFDPELFCDPVHLGPDGRDVFTAWITDWFADYSSDLPARSTP